MLTEFKEYAEDKKIAVASLLDASRQLYEAYEKNDPHFEEYVRYVCKAVHLYQTATGYNVLED